MNLSKKVILPYAELVVIENNIVCIKVTNEVDVDASKAMEIIDAIDRLSEKKSHAVLYDLNNKNVSADHLTKSIAAARSLASTGVFARAYVCYNLSNKLEVNHFIKFAKPQTPTQVFSNFIDAIIWIKETENNPES